MKAMILAAGEGTRLRPLTLERPKPMLPIGGKPLLEHIIDLLKRHGIREIAINLCYKPQAVIGYFGDGRRFGVEITYSIESPILGTAGAVKKLQDYFDKTFIVVYGDLLTDLDITSLVEYHKGRGGMVTVALYKVENPSACGLVDLNERGRIQRFVEKPPPEEVFTDLANAGVYVVEPDVIDHIPSDTLYDFGQDLFPALLERGVPVYGYPIKDYLIDIGTLEKYERAQWEWSRR